MERGSVTHLLNTGAVPAALRCDVVHETIADTIVRVDISFPSPRGPTVRGAITDFGDLTVCSVKSNALKVERTPELARDHLEPSIFVGLQLAGSSMVVQDGRTAVLRPGDLAYSDSTSPYLLLDDEGIRQHFFRITQSALGLPPEIVRGMAARTLTPGDPVADIVATYLRRLASRPDIFTRDGAESVSRPSVDLVRAVIATHAGESTVRAESLRATLRVRILEYARSRLADPGLGADEIAAHVHVSVRQLYKVLAEGDLSLADWLRTERLERCRVDLSHPGASAEGIADVARRWGFRDGSSFARAFRAVYGTSPREWRAQHAQSS
ncbi:AraC-like DNA-binding protein [Motilibacter peucedani]|uniref:AraC-like DNA-binding protein n=1 Tax=Motilibacter peucedani TaxID=598650 RepID=A0A420XSV4_9ACTN|nr:helix-turn-helix domain-containing protein [Motilibacter peucedani]RKS79925.1 AraC-like DNA-binding protein [Motilibacter peucedani]